MHAAYMGMQTYNVGPVPYSSAQGAWYEWWYSSVAVQGNNAPFPYPSASAQAYNIRLPALGSGQKWMDVSARYYDPTAYLGLQAEYQRLSSGLTAEVIALGNKVLLNLTASAPQVLAPSIDIYLEVPLFRPSA